MKGDAKVIDYLNRALKRELTSVNQYFLHARMLDNWGFLDLGRKIHEESIDEMKHADKLIQRILFLEGLPNLQDLDRLLIGETVKEILECDLESELIAHPLYKEAVGICEKANDYVSRELFEELLGSEEQHIDWLETQIALIDKIGQENYLQSRM